MPKIYLQILNLSPGLDHKQGTNWRPTKNGKVCQQNPISIADPQLARLVGLNRSTHFFWHVLLKPVMG